MTTTVFVLRSAVEPVAVWDKMLLVATWSCRAVRYVTPHGDVVRAPRRLLQHR